MNHVMKLRPEPFAKIKNGGKIIELRLNDEKRQRIALGDEIRFLLEPERAIELRAEVVALLRYPTFRDLINDIPVEYLGGGDKSELTAGMHQYYSVEDEIHYGVLGIKIRLI